MSDSAKNWTSSTKITWVLVDGVYVDKFGIAFASHSNPIREMIFSVANRLSNAGLMTSVWVPLRRKLYALIIKVADLELLMTP